MQRNRIFGEVHAFQKQHRCQTANAQADAAIEEVQPFGDRFHCRIRPGTLAEVMARLPGEFAAANVTLHYLRPIAPTLEDVFINLLN